MLTKEAIQELAQAQAISAADDAIGGAFSDGSGDGLVALPKDFSIHDIEKHLSARRRARGSMETSVIEDFGRYVSDYRLDGAACFVDSQRMQAIAVLNLGTSDAPGHADDTATLALRATAAYTALRKITDSGPTSQRVVAEFLEDWPGELVFYREGQSVTPGAAIAAVRDITIEHLKKQGSSEQQLSAERSTFEKVAAAGELPLPTHLYFTAVPFLGLTQRTFVMRLGLQTGGSAPAIGLRIVTLEKHIEEMAVELASLVRQALGDELPVLVGSYTAKP